MRWCTLGFTFPTLLSGRKANLLGSKNVGEVNPNVHHLILVSTLHTFLFFEFFLLLLVYLFVPTQNRESQQVPVYGD